MDMDFEEIKNWFRANLFRVLDAAEDGSLHARYLLRYFRALEVDPKNNMARESLLRHMDAFERLWEKRQCIHLRKALRRDRALRMALAGAIVAAALGMAMLTAKILF